MTETNGNGNGDGAAEPTTVKRKRNIPQEVDVQGAQLEGLTLVANRALQAAAGAALLAFLALGLAILLYTRLKG